MEEVEGCYWGTWEELLLGGAVLRHGTHDWDVVAAELRARSVSPFIAFTAEVCKSKYEDLQQRYSGCTTWFEELRKKRIAELRQALEVSEDSIGSLETKLEILNAEQKSNSQVSYDSSRTESGIPCQKCDEVEFSSKETSKDGLSAGSFTQETRANWSPECRIPISVPAEEMENKPEVSASPQQENALIRPKVEESAAVGRRGMLKGRRGKRKRKYIIKDAKEGSVGESVFGSADVVSATWCRENSASSSGQNTGSSHVDDRCRDSNNDKSDDLMGIFNTVADNKCASVFRRRLDSQKRGRYKKMIMQHLDFDTIRSRIASHCITSTKEVFRDLLLLANNALVFYSRTTREYKSALLLREIVTKSLKQHLKEYISRNTIHLLSATLPLLNPPVKPRSARPNNSKLTGKVKNDGKVVLKARIPGKQASNAESHPLAESLPVKKAGPGRTKKAGRGSASQRPENLPAKGRKRTRTK